MKRTKLASTTTLLVIAAMMLALLLPLAAAGMASAAPTNPIVEYPITTSSSNPRGIVTGPDGNLWFAEANANKIGKVTTSGSFTEYAVPTSSSFPENIVAGPDGKLWFTEEDSNKIAKVTTSGSFTEYPIPTSSSKPQGITVGPDGNLWFTEANGNKVGKVTTSGSFTEYPIPTLGSAVRRITAGPDGKLWFTETGAGKVVKVTTSGSFTEYPILTSNGHPEGITAGPDGNIWFTELTSDKIGKVTTSGTFTEFTIPAASSYPKNITAGPDGNLWFTEMDTSIIGRVTTSGLFTEYAIPTSSSGPWGITAGPSGNIWFTETNGNKVGKLQPITTTFYFAEGTCRPSFDPYFTIQNPGNATADIKLTYMKADGTTATATVNIPKFSRATVNPRATLGTGNDDAHDFSTQVQCTNGQQIIAERPMYFNYKGVWNGGSDVVGATSPQQTWYFSEGSCRPGFDPYFTIQNPGSVAANVKLTYMKGDSTSAFTTLTVPEKSRATVIPRNTLGTGDDAAHDFSTKVECTNSQQIIAEMPIYFDFHGIWTGGSDVMGATSPHLNWYFAEGTCRPDFEPYFTIQNPGNTTAHVTLTYMKGDSTTASATVDVPKLSRATISPSTKLGVGNDTAHDFSTKITSSLPIIAERPMYFDYNGAWTGGDNVVGATSPYTSFYFAEGTCRPHFDPYFTIQNPGSVTAAVTLTYMKGDGTTATANVSVPKNSRATVLPRNALGTGNDAAHDFSTKVTCTNSQLIIVERPMYFDYNGAWTGGSDVVGYTP